MKSIIVAYDSNRGIGIGGHLPWKMGEMKADMRQFRQITMGNVVIMGRKTMESIGKPLEGRRNIILTKQNDFVYDGAEIAHSLDEAFEMVSLDGPELFIIGGAEIYKQAIDKVDRIYATELVDSLNDIDVYFPDLNNTEWEEIDRCRYDSHSTGDKYDFDIVIYDRKKPDFVNLGNTRFDDQRCVMETIIKDGVCPFCTESLAKYHKKEILRTGEFWLLTYNQWPYKNTKLHLLIIAKHHVTNLSEMKPGAAEELFEILRWAEVNFNISYGGVCMRFGDIRQTGATVDHLHAHLIVPEENLSKDDKVRFSLSDDDRVRFKIS